MNRIKEVRQSKGVKQVDLAEELNITQATLSNWERGIHDPDSNSLKFLSDFFKVSIDFLLGKSDSPQPTPLDIPESLQGSKVGFHRSEFEELTQDEVDALALIADKLKAARMANKGK